MASGLRILGEGVRIKEDRRVTWKTAFALALMNHLVISGKFYLVKGSIKAELQWIISTLNGALESLGEDVPLLFVPFTTETTPEQLATMKSWADKPSLSPADRKGLRGMIKAIEDKQGKESGKLASLR
jgi:hypothetical protein